MTWNESRNRSGPFSPTRVGLSLVIDRLGVGVLAGFVGVGGGFLIVPALVLLGSLPMVLAVGTSLVIIALKSFTGFVKYLDVLEVLDLTLDWPVRWPSRRPKRNRAGGDPPTLENLRTHERQ